MKKICILLMGIFLFLFSANAQKRFKIKKGDLFARFGVTDLINPLENKVMLGLGYMANKRWMIKADIGYIFFSRDSKLKASYSSSGIAFEPALCWQYTKSKRQFIMLEGIYKNCQYKRVDWLGLNCYNGAPSYESWTDFTYKKITTGVSLKWGIMGRLRKKLNLWYEFNAGFTVRKITEKVTNYANACYIHRRDNLNIIGAYGTPDESSPNIKFGIKLMYNFKK